MLLNVNNNTILVINVITPIGIDKSIMSSWKTLKIKNTTKLTKIKIDNILNSEFRKFFSVLKTMESPELLLTELISSNEVVTNKYKIIIETINPMRPMN